MFPVTHPSLVCPNVPSFEEIFCRPSRTTNGSRGISCAMAGNHRCLNPFAGKCAVAGGLTLTSWWCSACLASSSIFRASYGDQGSRGGKSQGSSKLPASILHDISAANHSTPRQAVRQAVRHSFRLLIIDFSRLRPISVLGTPHFAFFPRMGGYTLRRDLANRLLAPISWRALGGL